MSESENKCKEHPDRDVVARGLCSSCYSAWYKSNKREERAKRKELIQAKREKELQWPKEPETKGKSLQAIARRILGQVITPDRVRVLLNQAYYRARKDDRMLQWLLGYVLPEKDHQPPVTVIVNSPLMHQESGKTYDVTGTPVDE